MCTEESTASVKLYPMATQLLKGVRMMSVTSRCLHGHNMKSRHSFHSCNLVNSTSAYRKLRIPGPLRLVSDGHMLFMHKPYAELKNECRRLCARAVDVELDLDADSLEAGNSQSQAVNVVDGFDDQTSECEGGVLGNDRQQLFPGELDTVNGFVEGESVKFWREWQWDDDTKGMTGLRNKIAAKLATNPLQGATYFSYHALRTSFFILNAYAGLTAAEAGRQGAGGYLPGISSTLQNLFPQLGYNLGEVSAMYLQDYENISKGIYKSPYDMSTSHKQSNPLYVASKVRAFITEAANTLRRRREQKAEDIWFDSKLYPKYYMNTWHYQTDGWMSSNSANVYETSTETLFLGRQDAMQRLRLVPLSSFVKEMQSEGKTLSDLSLLEVGAGTGRAFTFLVDNFPDMVCTCSELSPFYLQEARRNMSYYSQLKGKKTENVSFLQAAAEDLPLEDNSMDIVVNTYMFHELELTVLKKVVKEMGRVLKPGGMVVLTDSIQLGDRPKLDANLSNFTAFNEPNYTDYINLDLGTLFKEEAGLTPYAKEVSH